MNNYLRVELNGEAASCAALIAELRQGDYSLLIDRDGFLLIPQSDWEVLEQLADSFDCELESLEFSRRAA